MDFYDSIGRVALGSRLRRLGDRLAEDAAQIYALYGTNLQPRWFPVVHLLSERGQDSISAIAAEIGQSHVSVSQIVGEMVLAGYARLKKTKADGRKTFVTLSPKGRAALAPLAIQSGDVRAAVEAIDAETGVDLWRALAAWDAALARAGLQTRVAAFKAGRDQDDVEIVDYAPHFAHAFRSLNEEWITAHFQIEEADRRALNDPEGYILKPGGHILMAVRAGDAIGSAALIPHGAGCFELAKMAVTPAARGLGIGRRLAEAALRRASEQGATRVFLESNTKLTAAIALYEKLGFRRIEGEASPYQRCDIQMEKIL